MRIPHRNQNWHSPSQQSRVLRRNIGGPPISARSRIWSSLHSFTSFESKSIHHLPLHGRNGPSRCGTVIFVCGLVMDTSSHTQQGWRCYYKQTAQQYALHTQRMEQKGQWCTTVVVGGQSVLLGRLLEESQTSRSRVSDRDIGIAVRWGATLDNLMSKGYTLNPAHSLRAGGAMAMKLSGDIHSQIGALMAGVAWKMSTAFTFQDVG